MANVKITVEFELPDGSTSTPVIVAGIDLDGDDNPDELEEQRLLGAESEHIWKATWEVPEPKARRLFHIQATLSPATRWRARLVDENGAVLLRAPLSPDHVNVTRGHVTSWVGRLP